MGIDGGLTSAGWSGFCGIGAPWLVHGGRGVVGRACVAVGGVCGGMAVSGVPVGWGGFEILFAVLV